MKFIFDKNNSLLLKPFHYRYARTDCMVDEAFKRMPRAEIFTNTVQINTLYQLLAMSIQNPCA
jgi:rhamnulokinase